MATDLNPIENVWKILKDNVQQRRPPPNTYEALKTALLEEWENLDLSIFMNLIK
ncbi:30749_t:CDS:1, partial [Racocetra persica]